MSWEISAAARADLHALVQEWCRTHVPAANRLEAEQFALEVGQAAAEAAFEEAVAGCGTQAGYRGSSLPCRCGGRTRFVGYRRRWVCGQPGEGG